MRGPKSQQPFDYRCEFDVPKFCDLNSLEEDE